MFVYCSGYCVERDETSLVDLVVPTCQLQPCLVLCEFIPYIVDYYIYNALKEYKMERKKAAILCESCIFLSTFAEYSYAFWRKYSIFAADKKLKL